MNDTPIRVAVVTGGHSYDVPNFHRLFRALDGVEAYIQSIDDFSASAKAVREAYDVVLFYIMMMPTPENEGLPWYAGQPMTALSELGETEQGIVVLHHALLAYPEWPLWSEIVGIADRRFGYFFAETVSSEIMGDHPITHGISPWTMIDETYTMASAGEDSRVLLTYDHPHSMKTIAWTRQYHRCRVFCYEAGHDNATWPDPNFREVLRRGVLWAAHRI